MFKHLIRRLTVLWTVLKKQIFGIEYAEDLLIDILSILLTCARPLLFVLRIRNQT